MSTENKGTTNLELIELARKLKIKHFKGVIMSDEFDKLGNVEDEECAIFNTENSDSNGTHWQCYYKRKNKWFHFCSFGSSFPNSLKDYANGALIRTHDYKIQDWLDDSCGEFCILFLKLMNNPKLKYEDIVLFLVNQ